MDRHGGLIGRLRTYLGAGIITAIPIWITWLIFEFVLSQLQRFGMPWVRALARYVEGNAPLFSRVLGEPWFQSLLAIVVTLLALYLLGFAATRVVGRRLLSAFDRTMQRIPLVQTIYRSIKTLTTALEKKPERVERVVLIEFPRPGIKAIGFVTRTFRDESSGEELASVYVPTTPNPTSGYLEIVPVNQLAATGWSMDEAMTFIISGGTMAPETLRYGNDNGNGDHSLGD